MVYIVIDDQQAKLIADSTENVEIRDQSGRHLGVVARDFTDEDVAIARERMYSSEPRWTAAQVLQHLESQSSWMQPLLDKVVRLETLRENWDSYGARPIDPNIAQATIKLLCEFLTPSDPIPSIVPTAHGSILLEWHEGGCDLEVEMRSPTSIQLVFDDGNEQEESEQASFDQIRAKVDVLTSHLAAANGSA